MSEHWKPSWIPTETVSEVETSNTTGKCKTCCWVMHNDLWECGEYVVRWLLGLVCLSSMMGICFTLLCLYTAVTFWSVESYQCLEFTSSSLLINTGHKHRLLLLGLLHESLFKMCAMTDELLASGKNRHDYYSFGWILLATLTRLLPVIRCVGSA